MSEHLVKVSKTQPNPFYKFQVFYSLLAFSQTLDINVKFVSISVEELKQDTIFSTLYQSRVNRVQTCLDILEKNVTGQRSVSRATKWDTNSTI